MGNTLGAYNPTFFANEAMILVEKALGMANRVHRGYDEERKSFNKGDTVRIKQPGTFTVQDAPSAAQDVTTKYTDVSLTSWKEVKFALTDKELAYTSEKIIEDHIRPAAYAIADYIDAQLAALYKDIPWFVDLQSTTALRDITDVRQQMFDQQIPLKDQSLLHYMVNGSLENGFLQLGTFNTQDGAGAQGVNTQIDGTLGRKFGLNIFANQNVQTHTKGTADDAAMTVTSNVAAGVNTIGFSSAGTGTLVPGDTFVIAGNTQRYAITNTTTASGNAHTGVTFTPALVAAATATTVVTVRLDNHVANLAWHRNAFALAFAKLPELGDGMGARISSLQDPVTGLALRSRMYYDGDNSKVNVALDVLFGMKTLDPNLAVRACG